MLLCETARFKVVDLAGKFEGRGLRRLRHLRFDCLAERVLGARFLIRHANLILVRNLLGEEGVRRWDRARGCPL